MQTAQWIAQRVSILPAVRSEEHAAVPALLLRPSALGCFLAIMAEVSPRPWFSPFLGVMYVLLIGLYRGKAWYV